jgi:two-component system, NarL family, response regulator DegU
MKNRYPYKSIQWVKNLEPELSLQKNDLLIIYTHEWGGRLLSKLKKLQTKGVKIIIWFDSSRKDIATPYLKEGFDGYIPHDVAEEQLIKAIDSIENDDYYIHTDLVNILYLEFLRKIRHLEPLDQMTSKVTLTNREWDVLKQMTEGFSNEAIAQNLRITINTVKNHVSAILKKLQVPSRNAAIVKAIQYNLVVK